MYQQHFSASHMPLIYTDQHQKSFIQQNFYPNSCSNQSFFVPSPPIQPIQQPIYSYEPVYTAPPDMYYPPVYSANSFTRRAPPHPIDTRSAAIMMQRSDSLSTSSSYGSFQSPTLKMQEPKNPRKGRPRSDEQKLLVSGNISDFYHSVDLDLSEFLNEQKNVFQCKHQDCIDIRFRKRDRFLEHLAELSDLRPFICDICSFGFRTIQSVKRHIKDSHMR